MRFTQAFIPTRKDDPADAEVPSHKLLIRGGFIEQVSAGIYNILPLGWRSVRKISQIIREELERAGALEILMPIVQPAELWKRSGRWANYGTELTRLKDRKGKDYCLGPTHEEVITDLIGRHVRSYRDMPLNLYQIQVKFRDELRPRAGLLRGREFLMKDAYSFNTDMEGAANTYEKMRVAYNRIFARCGLNFRMVEAATGNIGGSQSHEFQVLAQTGEDRIVSCASCEYTANQEMAQGDACPHCETALAEFRGIEVGHIFLLGTKYSEPMKATFLDADGDAHPVVMGCYGIGVTRVLAAAIEQNHDDNGMVFPMAIAPYQVIVLPLQMKNEAVVEAGEKVYEALREAGVEVVLDDRDLRAGGKFKDSDLIGVPLRIAIGARGVKNGEIEIKHRSEKDAEMVPMDDVVSVVKARIEALLVIRSPQ